jgi:hypothetical protein
VEADVSSLLDPGVLTMLIPIVALLIPIVAIGGGLYYRWNRDKLVHETIRLMVEKGQPIPPELLASENCSPRRISGGLAPRRDPKSLLRQGLGAIFAGLGLIAMFLVMDHGMLWAIGMVPFAVGVGLLVAWLLESKRQQ